MPINLSVEFPQLQSENMKLRYQNKELVKALKQAMNIIERINDEYSSVAKKHGSYTQGEYKDLNAALKMQPKTKKAMPNKKQFQ